MNTYNDNLRTNVVSSLSDQETEIIQAKGALDAQEISLYYAQGQRISASEKLGGTLKSYEAQQKIQAAAVHNNDLVGNLNDAATQEKKYVDQSVTNVAIAASNVQLATNAIVRLAGDMGNILGIVNAADYDTQIYHEALEVKDFMDETAYLSEVASQLAMEASMKISEVSASTVLNQATNTKGQINTLYTNLTAQFNTISQALAADNVAMSDASAIEKKSEGLTEELNTDYYSVLSAYKLNNQELNLGLDVPNDSLYKTNTFYTVRFNQYQPPFREIKEKAVAAYYIMLVKETSKSTFSSASADSLLGNKEQFVRIEPTSVSPLPMKSLSARPLPITPYDFNQKIMLTELKDSDGQALSLGVNYVVFVLVELTDAFKKKINIYEDILTAPSMAFNLTNELNSPMPSKTNLVCKYDELIGTTLSFQLVENKNYKVEYRVMFLPDNRKLVQDLLTVEALRNLELEVHRLEEIANLYDPVIEKLESTINNAETTILSLNQQIKILTEKIDQTAGKEKEKLEEDLKNLKDTLTRQEKILSVAKIELTKTEKDKKNAENSVDPAAVSKPGFFFNLALAEQVPAGSYSIATIDKKKSEPVTGSSTDVHIHAELILDFETTDNFGNKLENDKTYIPVVLSYAIGDDDNQDQFTNALSKFSITEHFNYKPKKTVKKD
jgi:hypothetical protein